MKKKILFIASVLILGFSGLPLFAQENQDKADTQEKAAEIEMPDLTTVVEGSPEETQNIPTPDFSKVVSIPSLNGEIELELPQENPDDIQAPDLESFEAAEKSIYAQGEIGGGYPATFISDFTVSNLFGSNPFKVNFNHFSQAGFAGKALSQGYNTTDTSITVDKDFSTKNTLLKLNGVYQDAGNGLQGKAENIASVKQNFIAAGGNFSWQLPKNFTLGAALNSDLYLRYGDISLENTNWTSYLVNPELFVKFKAKGFETGFTADYILNGGKGLVNRGEFDLDFSWTGNIVKCYADAGFVLSDSLNNGIFTVPFNAGVDLFIPVSFSDGKLKLGLSGGMESEQTLVSEYERKYKFTAFDATGKETSYWNTKFNFALPVKDSFSVKGSAEYKLTAFGNGEFVPVYDDSHCSGGLYGYEQRSIETLGTKLALNYEIKGFSIDAGWNAWWMDVPALTSGQQIFVKANYRTAKGGFGANADFIYSLDSDDKVPQINLGVSAGITSNVTVKLQGEDIIKLILAQERTYAGQYISQSGNVTLVVKFLF